MKGKVEPGYLPRQVVAMTGVPYSTLNLWAKTGFVTPSIQGGNGTGHDRMYSAADVEILKIAQSMKAAGLTIGVIAKAIHKFREYPKSKRIEVLLSRQPEIFISVRKDCSNEHA
jgi:DNA-binding transcriptional MerR regulator